MSWKTTALIAAGLLFFLNLVVPPFQNPDEPFHFAAAVLYARGGGAAAPGAQEEVEAEVLRMMDRSHWWRLVGIGRPQPLPKRISEIAFLREGADSDDFQVRLSSFRLWHWMTGWVMKPAARGGVEGPYYLGRAASSAFLIAAFLLLWKTFLILGRIFGEGARLGFYFVFFLPQIWLMGTSVSTDAFVAFLCAAFFYNTAVLLEKAGGPGFRWTRAMAGRMGLIVGLTFIGLLTDRSTVVLAPLALLLVIMVLRRTNPKTVAPILLLGAIGVIWIAYFAALRFPMQTERIFQAISLLAKNAGPSFFKAFDITGSGGRFWVFVADTFLLKFGWLVFAVPRVVYWAWRISLIAVGLGLVARVVWWAKARMNDEGEAGGEAGEGRGVAGVKLIRRQWLWLAVAAIGFQAAGMWMYYGANSVLAQGRYFFPVIAPVAFVLVFGFEAFGDMIRKGLGKKLLAGVIMAEFLILALGLWTHIVPAFHLILRGPHPGV